MENMTIANIALLLGALFVLIGIASSLLASRFGAPLLLIFLVLGMLAGQDGIGGIVFDDFRATYLIGSAALAIILFDGGLRTRLASFRGVLAPAAMLATFGVLITTLATGTAATLILGLSLVEGLLVGAIVSSTDAAAVFFLMRSKGMKLRRRVNNTIEIESATNDPVAVFLTIALVEVLLVQQADTGWVIGALLLQQGVIGAALGVLGGMTLVWALNRFTLPHGLHPLLAVSAAILIFSLTSVLGGSGFLAVYLAGLIVGNRPVRAFPTILSFHDAATWLSQIVMFLVLGLLATPSTLVHYALPAILISAFLILIGRPLAVWLCLTPFGFGKREKNFISWVGLRGAVSIFLAAIPTLTAVPNAEVYFNIAFFVVLISLLVQGWSVGWMATRLGQQSGEAVADPQRLEIDLPGQLELEMVGYPITENSPVLARAVYPSWMRVVMIVRDGEVLTPEAAGPLRAGDYGYFLAPPARVPRLDRLFASGDGGKPPALGMFSFSGDATVEDVARLYGLHVPADLKKLSIAEAFDERFEDRVDVGDRIAIEPAFLMATTVQNDEVAAVTVEFEEPDEKPATPTGRMIARLRAWRSRRALARSAALAADQDKSAAGAGAKDR
ncbi:potassium/proton antiporter [Saliniramus sp.]|uniref:potassium/proton antiporter n=1 Tax=Saliniramus sp. TaxID=2986772 RepID=UPI002C8D471C|nr:potassium/proton antiporter [Saliniramus sp.]HMB12003.1 potassium/proton antiporter [Saliniramus sp.]